MSLVARDLWAGYRRDTVVRAVSCTITPGQMTAVIGPNGSGKSTLVRCLARALPPRRGAVLLDGADLYALSPRKTAAYLAYAPQETAIGFDFTVRELVALGAERAATPTPPLAERVMQALRTLDLEPLAGRSLLTLSGGERQRAAIARALAQSTPYLLLDEPTAHLDLRHQIQLLHLLRRAAREQGRAVLVVLHDLNQAAGYADTLLLLQHGQILAQGAPPAVLTPEQLGQVYQTPVYVKRHPASGRPWVLTPPPSEDVADQAPAAPDPVHVLCGGGTGTPLLAALRGARVPVTAGILSPLDGDAETADALGIVYTPDAPFSPVSENALLADAVLRRRARHVVVSDFPIGPGNLALLQAAAESAAAGQSVVLLAGDAIRERDFTGGEGQRVWEALRRQARIAPDPEAVLRIVLPA